MKGLAIALLLLLTAATGKAESIKIDKTFVVVLPSAATEAEKYAASELITYLKLASGIELAIVPEKADKSAIKLEYSPELKGEEWEIRTEGKNIVIAGGRPRGVLYGVYEFLENFAGCRWYDLYTEYVPERKELIIPDKVNIRKQPVFFQREIYWLVKNMPRDKFQNFCARAKLNTFTKDRPDLGWSERSGSPSGCHSYLAYAADFPTEVCWMNEKGERVQVKTTTGGQICYTHPEVRRRMAEKLRQYIEADRVEAGKAGKPYPVIYNMSANDCSVPCHCAACLASAKKYGISGMVIDFTNSVAAAIAKNYPEIIVEIFAYKEAVTPPHGIRPRDNVMIEIADMDTEFGGVGARDVLRPCNVPQNKAYAKLIDDWRKTTKKLSIWDYWKLYYDPFPSPKTSVSSLAGYLRKYREAGALKIFIEAEIDERAIDSFIDLRTWLAAKLMVDPQIDDAAAIADFMNGFYGPAAAPMNEYLRYLEKRMPEEKRPLGRAFTPTRAFLDRGFFAETSRLLDEAEALAAENPRQLLNVRQERLVVDLALLNMGDKFPNSPVELSKDKLTERMLANLESYGQKYFTAEHWQKIGATTQQFFLSKLNPPPLPDSFKDKVVIDFSWGDFEQRFVVADPDADTGRAHTVPMSHYGLNEPLHGRDPAFGIYDFDAKKALAMRIISKAELPHDEKYHLYYLGRVNVPDSNVKLWAHWSWLMSCKVTRAHDPLNSDTFYDVYVSLKFQGPSYVPGSKSTDDMRFERAIFAKVHRNDPLPSRKEKLP